MLSSKLRKVANLSASFVAYCLLSVLSTWPLCSNFETRLPLASEDARTVPYFNMWTLGWNIHCANNVILPYSTGYWNAPIFFPEQNSLAMSEVQPATMVLAAPFALFRSLTVVYNIYFLISIALNGWVSYLVLRSLKIRDLISFVGGAAMTLLPIVHWQAGVLQLVPVWGLVWAFYSLAKVIGVLPEAKPGTADKQVTNSMSNSKQSGSQPSLIDGTMLGLSLSLSFAMSAHHGLFLSALCGIGVLPFLHTFLNRHRAGALMVAGSVFFMLTGPLVYKHYLVNQKHGFAREVSVVEQLSAKPTDYISVFGRSYLRCDPDPKRAWHLSPGFATSILAILGILSGCFSSNRRRLTAFLTVIGGAAFVLSLGTNFQVGPVNLWQIWSDCVPGFGQVRSSYRFAYFVQIISVVLGALAVEQAWGTLSGTQTCWSRTLKASVVVFGVLAAFDPWPPAMKLAVPPSLSSHDAEWIERLTEAPPGALLILPCSTADTVQDYESVSEWMVTGLQHGKPLVNGYSGFFPSSHTSLMDRCRDGLTLKVQEELARLGVRYILVNSYYSRLASDDFDALKQLTSPNSRVQLYEITIAVPLAP